MAPTATRPAPDLEGRLAQARAEAEQLATELNTAEARLARALERADYPAAESAKAAVEAVRPHLALATATEAALAQALRALDADRQQAQAAAQEHARREAAQAVLDQALGAEHEARESATRHLAEALAGLDAIRGSLVLAKEAEQRGHQARHAAAQARAEVEGSTSLPVVSQPNWASGRIGRSPVLVAILAGREDL